MSDVKQVDIKIFCYEDFELNFIHRDTDGDPVDLTGAVLRGILRKYPAGTDPIDFVMTNFGASGKVRMQMTSEQTGELSYPYGEYEVDCTFPDDTTETILRGKAFIVPAVTRITTGTPEIILAFNSFDEFPEVGTYFRLYLDIEAGLLYRWNGTSYESALFGLQGDKGEDGRGIESISKVSTSGNVDRYQIVYTDGTSTYFYVTNGTSIATIQKTGTAGLVDTYTITLTDGSTSTFNVTNGSSIASFQKTASQGVVDTYTITLTNGETFNFTIRNGSDGVSPDPEVGNMFRNHISIISPFSESDDPADYPSDYECKNGDRLYSKQLALRDVDNHLMTAIRWNIQADKEIITRIDARRTVNGSAVDNYIFLRIAEDGTMSVQVPSQLMWRNALGADNGVWPASMCGPDSGWLALSGTGSDGYTGTIYYRKIGNLVEVRGSQLTPTGDIGTTYIQLGTLPEGYKPTTDRVILNASYRKTALNSVIFTGGNIYVCASTGSLTSGENSLYIQGQFFVG